MTVKEFAEYAGINRDHVYRLMKQNAIPYYEVGRSKRLNPEDFRVEAKEVENEEFGYEG